RPDDRSSRPAEVDKSRRLLCPAWSKGQTQEALNRISHLMPLLPAPRARQPDQRRILDLQYILQILAQRHQDERRFCREKHSEIAHCQLQAVRNLAIVGRL